MELRHFKYFIAVAEELHFGKAADRLNITQPPLSRQIKELEEEIGAKLFIRTKQTVKLTEAGNVFRNYAYDILNKVEEACRETVKTSKGINGSILIGYASGLIEALMNIVLSFKEKYPNINIVLKQSLSPDVIQDIKEGKLDIGVLPTFESDAFHFLPISQSSNVVVMPLNHRLANDSSPLPIKELKDEPFIISARSSLFFLRDKAVCNLAGFEPNIAQEVLGLPTVLSCVASGMGVSIVTKATLKSQENPNVFSRELIPPYDTETSIVWKKNNQSPALDAFVAFAKEYIDANGVLSY